MFQQHGVKQRLLIASLMVGLSSSAYCDERSTHSKTFLQRLVHRMPSFFSREIQTYEAMTIGCLILTMYAVAKRNSRSEAQRLRTEENLSWHDLLNVHEITTKDYWKRFVYLAIGTFEKVKEITIKRKTDYGWEIRKDKEYIPSTGVFCTLHDFFKEPVSDVIKLAKDSKEYIALFVSLIGYQIYQETKSYNN